MSLKVVHAAEAQPLGGAVRVVGPNPFREALVFRVFEWSSAPPPPPDPLGGP